MTHRQNILIWSTLLAMLAAVAHAQTITGPINPVAPLTKLQAGKFYEVGGAAVNIPSGTTLDITGATIHGHTGDGVLVRFNGNDCKLIGGGTIDGGGVYADGGKQNLLVDGPTIQNSRNDVGFNQQGGLGFIGCSNVTCRNFLVQHCPYGAILYGNSNVTFEHFEATAINYGFKFDGTGTNWRATNFWVHDCPNDFMALEFQGTPINVLIDSFIVERIGYGPNQADNDHSLLLSIPADKGSNITIRKGAIAGRRPKDDAGGRWSDGHPVAIEAGGDNFMIEDVLIDGAGWAVSVTDMAGTCSGTVRNNQMLNVWEQVILSSSTQKVTQANNGPSVVLTWTMDQLRREVGRVTAPPVIPPTTIPVFRWPPTINMTAPGTQPANYDLRK
jgi:hypothetical protein